MAEDATLAGYLAKQRIGKPCWCTTAPKDIVRQVDDAIGAGSHQWTPIIRWLDSNGIKVTEAQLKGHASKGHAENPPT